MHWFEEVQVLPVARFATQVPALQYVPDVQFASVLQAPQAVAEHSPLQQLPLAHCPLLEHAPPFAVATWQSPALQ